LKQKLFILVNEHHLAFLAAHRLTYPDAFSVQQWHHSFDPHLVPEVPLAELKPMP